MTTRTRRMMILTFVVLGVLLLPVALVQDPRWLYDYANFMTRISILGILLALAWGGIAWLVRRIRAAR